MVSTFMVALFLSFVEVVPLLLSCCMEIVCPHSWDLLSLFPHGGELAGGGGWLRGILLLLQGSFRPMRLESLLSKPAASDGYGTALQLSLLPTGEDRHDEEHDVVVGGQRNHCNTHSSSSSSSSSVQSMSE